MCEYNLVFNELAKNIVQSIKNIEDLNRKLDIEIDAQMRIIREGEN